MSISDESHSDGVLDAASEAQLAYYEKQSHEITLIVESDDGPSVKTYKLLEQISEILINLSHKVDMLDTEINGVGIAAAETATHLHHIRSEMLDMFATMIPRP